MPTTKQSSKAATRSSASARGAGLTGIAENDINWKAEFEIGNEESE